MRKRFVRGAGALVCTPRAGVARYFTNIRPVRCLRRSWVRRQRHVRPLANGRYGCAAVVTTPIWLPVPLPLGGTLVILIPPSVTMILYGIASRNLNRPVCFWLVFCLGSCSWVVHCLGVVCGWRRGSTQGVLRQAYTWVQRIDLLLKLVTAAAGDCGRHLQLCGGIATRRRPPGVGDIVLNSGGGDVRMWHPSALWAILRDSLRGVPGMLLMIIGMSVLFGYAMSSSMMRSPWRRPLPRWTSTAGCCWRPLI